MISSIMHSVSPQIPLDADMIGTSAGIRGARSCKNARDDCTGITCTMKLTFLRHSAGSVNALTEEGSGNEDMCVGLRWWRLMEAATSGRRVRIRTSIEG